MNIEQLDKRLSSYKFLPEGGRACFFYPHYEIIRQFSLPGLPWSINYKKIDTSFGAYSRNHLVRWYFIADGEEHFINFLERYLKNPRLIEDLKNYTENLKNKILKQVDKDFSKSSNEELGKTLSDYYDLYQGFFKSSATLRTIDRGVVMSVRRYYKEKADKILRTITISDKPTVLLQEEFAILNLALKLKEENKTIESSGGKSGINKLLKKYVWNVLGYYNEQPNNYEIFRKRISVLIKENPKILLAGLKKRLAQEKAKRSKLLKSLPAKEKKIAFLAAEIPYLKDYVKSRINEAQFYAEPLFMEIAERTKKTVNYIKDLAIGETKTLLVGGSIDETMVRRRTKENFLIAWQGEMFALVGKEAGFINNKYIGQDLGNTVKELKGRIASPGRAEGRAAIVFDPAGFNKVRDGDILVVINTSPDFIPVIRRAAAIVAEEGGLTAHVSVVSREFGVPCVVGVRGATSRLKDGDLVEVDADKGVVKIISK